MGVAKEKGRMEGRQEGRMARQEEIARNALAEGSSIEFVQKITGLERNIVPPLIPKRGMPDGSFFMFLSTGS